MVNNNIENEDGRIIDFTPEDNEKNKTIDPNQISTAPKKEAYVPKCEDFVARQSTEFFMFVGSSGSGKSNVIKALLHNISIRKDATHSLIGDRTKSYVRDAMTFANDLITNNLLIIDSTQSASMMEIDIEFKPNGFPPKLFTFLETGGEAHKQIIPNGDAETKLPEHIDTYLLCPYVKRKTIIFVVSAIANQDEAAETIKLVSNYLDHLRDIRVDDKIRYLMILTKWDLLPDKGKNTKLESLLQGLYDQIYARLKGLQSNDLGEDKVAFTQLSLGENITPNGKDEKGRTKHKIWDWGDQNSPREKYASKIVNWLYGMKVVVKITWWQRIKDFFQI